VQGERLVQVAVGAQEVAELGREPHRMDSQPVRCCVIRAGLHVRPLGLQPGFRVFRAGQRWRSCWRIGHRRYGRRGTLGGEPIGGGCGVQVVVQQPLSRPGNIGGIVRSGEGVSVLAEQVVLLVPVRCGFGQQMLVI